MNCKCLGVSGGGVAILGTCHFNIHRDRLETDHDLVGSEFRITAPSSPHEGGFGGQFEVGTLQ